jgi:hypothetical protein
MSSFKSSVLSLEGGFKIISNNSLPSATATLLLVKPFKENLGSLVWDGKLASYILLWKKDTECMSPPS